MKLEITERYIKEGIKMRKLVHAPIYGMFTTSSAVYDYMTVYDLNEAVELTNQGWSFCDATNTFANITLMMYRDLKQINLDEK